ncbi:hypothetical protein LTR85_005161 [Meristemomyces frigidus]|nr:hypothetical protein LTR85_005161 [Meristemomyces frigidus]
MPSAMSSIVAASISKRIDKNMSRQQPAITQSSGEVIMADAEEAAQSLPSPPPSAKKDPPDLHSLLELADQYIPRTSTAEQVEYSNPKKFCVKPAYWKRWDACTYASFANELRSQFDPVPFARKHRIPLEEVQEVFSAIVCNPLYDAAEAKRRGEEGMQELLDAYNKYGTPSRRWGKVGGKIVEGELARIEEGVVVLTGRETGNKCKLPAVQLNDADIEDLRATVTESEMEMLKLDATNTSADIVMID